MKFYRILKIFFIHSKVRGDNRKLDFTERNILVFTNGWSGDNFVVNKLHGKKNDYTFFQPLQMRFFQSLNLKFSCIAMHVIRLLRTKQTDKQYLSEEKRQNLLKSRWCIFKFEIKTNLVSIFNNIY